MKPRAKSVRRYLAAVALAAAQVVARVWAGEAELLPVSSAYFHEAWQTEQGLPHNNVPCIVQGPDRYLWIVSARGVVRFDGSKLSPVVPPGIPSPPRNEIHRILFDHHERLWITTQSGELHSLTNGRVTPVGGPSGPVQEAYEVSEDGEGGIWVVSEQGKVKYLNESGWHDLGIPGRGRMGPSTLARDVDGQVWLASHSALGYFKDGQWREQLHGLLPALTLAPRRAGGIWLVAGQRLIAVSSRGETNIVAAIPWPVHDTEVRQLLEDRKGAVWMATNRRGLLRYAAGRLEQVPVHHPSVLALYEDAEGNLWYGTQGGGVGRLRERLFDVLGVSRGLPNDIIHSVSEDRQSNLWVVCQDGGISRVSNGVCHTLGLADGWVQTVPLSVAALSDDSIWVGTFSEGLVRWQSGQAERIPRTPALPGERVNALLADTQGRLWVGFHGQGVSCISATATNNYTNGLSGLYITSLAEDSLGRIWVGNGDGGIVRFKDEEVVVVTPTMGDGIIHALLPEADGTVWVGTSIGGLMRIKQGVRSSVTRMHGLPDDSIFQFLLDGAGQLWCGSSRGLFRVSLQELNEVADGRADKIAVFTYGRSDGLADFPFSNVASPANCRARDGRFWFATAKGVVSFRPDELPVNREVPPVVIEEVQINGGPVAPRDGLVFSSQTERFQFHYTALSFTAPDKVRFRHRMDGVDADWVEAGANRQAVYSQLKPGSYRFQVIAANNDGVWNLRGATLSFTVEPVFWQTRWFAVVAAGLLAAGGVGAFRLATVRRLRRRLARLHEQHTLEQERTRIAQDIHDELGASLTQIGMLASFAGKSVDRPVEVAADLKKITDTAHEAVRAMDAIVWAINPHNNSLENFAAYVSRFAESFLPSAGLRFRFDAPADLPEQSLGSEQRHQLFLVVREALNNVVRHARAQEVWLRLTVRDGWFVVQIEDDGRGLPASEPEPGSDGLANMRRRIESIGGVFEVESKPSAGTRLKIRLPLAGSGGLEPGK